jgi:hypothetical protein
MLRDDGFASVFGSRRGIDPRFEAPHGSLGTQRIWEHDGMHCVITRNEYGFHDGWVRFPPAIAKAVGKRWYGVRTGDYWQPEDGDWCWTLDSLILEVEHKAAELARSDGSEPYLDRLRVELGLVVPF